MIDPTFKAAIIQVYPSLHGSIQSQLTILEIGTLSQLWKHQPLENVHRDICKLLQEQPLFQFLGFLHEFTTIKNSTIAHLIHSIGDKTLKTYISGFRNYLRYFNKNSQTRLVHSGVPAKTEDISSWLISIPHPGTAKAYFAAIIKLHLIFNFEVNFDNPRNTAIISATANLFCPRPKERHPISTEVLQTIVDHFLNTHQPIMAYLCILGFQFSLRIPSELLIAKRSQISIAENSISVSFSFVRRKFQNQPLTQTRLCSCTPLNDDHHPPCVVFAAQAILQRLSPGERITSISASAFTRFLRSALAAANIPHADSFSSHDLRRGIPDIMARNGASPAELQFAGGWQNVRSSSSYINTSQYAASIIDKYSKENKQ